MGAHECRSTTRSTRKTLSGHARRRRSAPGRPPCGSSRRPGGARRRGARPACRTLAGAQTLLATAGKVCTLWGSPGSASLALLLNPRLGSLH